MQKPFPPGDITWKNKIKSDWREFGFMFHQMQQAIDPAISLKVTMLKWDDICYSLGENNRIRKPQTYGCFS